jgi:hypothetical protein
MNTSVVEVKCTKCSLKVPREKDKAEPGMRCPVCWNAYEGVLVSVSWAIAKGLSQ